MSLRQEEKKEATQAAFIITEVNDSIYIFVNSGSTEILHRGVRYGQDGKRTL